MTKISNRLGQGWDIVVLVAAYAKITALVGLYALEKACRALMHGVAGPSRAPGPDHRQRRR